MPWTENSMLLTEHGRFPLFLTFIASSAQRISNSKGTVFRRSQVCDAMAENRAPHWCSPSRSFAQWDFHRSQGIVSSLLCSRWLRAQRLLRSNANFISSLDCGFMSTTWHQDHGRYTHKDRTRHTWRQFKASEKELIWTGRAPAWQSSTYLQQSWSTTRWQRWTAALLSWLATFGASASGDTNSGRYLSTHASGHALSNGKTDTSQS